MAVSVGQGLEDAGVPPYQAGRLGEVVLDLTEALLLGLGAADAEAKDQGEERSEERSEDGGAMQRIGRQLH